MRMSSVKKSEDFIESHINNQRGQTLLIALVIMFLLVFMAGIFAAMLVRNVSRTKRSGETQNADYLAEAGINFADEQLTYSADGADWRPTPQYPVLVRSMYDSTIVPQPGDLPDPRDPDYKWLMQGFSRYAYGNGRFLLRVTYEPNGIDPLSKYIKIESIGRLGIVDERDPTTWKSQPERLRSERVAYKSIGITDYARYVTNKDHRKTEINLGAPGYVTTYGELKNSKKTGELLPGDLEGAPIRANGDLAWYGTNYIYLNADRGDTVEVAGDIRHANIGSADDDEDAVASVTINKSADSGYVAQESAAYDPETGETLFSTFPLRRSDGTTSDVGSYRDGRPEGDRNSPNPLPRSISRIEPPIIDANGPAGGLGRYRDLTRNSGEWRQAANGEWYNTGFYGWGDGVYIDNRLDVQSESSVYTLRGNWTKPGTQFWNGPYYTPPGINIYLTQYDLDNADGDDNIHTGPDMIITHDSAPGQPKFNWFDKDGNIIPSAGGRMIVPYPKNGVVFAEGNIRIKGTLPAAPTESDEYSNKLTVVSGGTIYIEGNILKNDKNGQGMPTDEKDSAIALLAKDYVCVNTTQFFAPTSEILPASSGGEHFEVTPDRWFWMNFAFGADGIDLVDGTGRLYFGQELPVKLYVRHTSPIDYGASYINMLINYPSNDPDPYAPLYRFWTDGDITDYIYALGDATLNQKEPGWEYAVFPLAGNGIGDSYGKYTVYTGPGEYNSIAFKLDQSVTQNTGMLNYYISRAAVMPSDIRIEALMYAQNGSFFVIPGEWFNPDPADSRANYDDLEERPIGVNNEWPFYGEPMDVRVIVYGAVSENLPASVGDCIDWMEKWGWIPDQHGCADVYTTSYRKPLHPDNESDFKRKGITLIYDPILSDPMLPNEANGTRPLRTDEYGRPLPVTPKLPVSTQLLFFGEAA